MSRIRKYAGTRYVRKIDEVREVNAKTKTVRETEGRQRGEEEIETVTERLKLKK